MIYPYLHAISNLTFETNIRQTELGTFLSQFCDFGVLRGGEKGARQRQETNGLLDGEHNLLEHAMDRGRIHGGKNMMGRIGYKSRNIN